MTAKAIVLLALYPIIIGVGHYFPMETIVTILAAINFQLANIR